MELILIRGYCQANQSGGQGLVKLLWQILQIGNASYPPSTSACLSSMGNAEIQKAEGSLAQGNTLGESHYAS